MMLFSYVTKLKEIIKKQSVLIVSDSDTDDLMENPPNF